MTFLKLIFFLGVALTFYSYIGYGLLIWILVKIRDSVKPKKVEINDFLPDVTLIIAAYNEEDFIRTKIKNTLSLDYPEGQLKIIFITDGSSDSTPAIVEQHPRIQLLHQQNRDGKVAAMHRAMSYVTTDFVVFSDANTLLNSESIRNIVRHYKRSEVGGVAGEKKVLQSVNDVVAGAGEGLYWKYESFLKKLDSRFYTVVGAAGELFSIRTALYEFPGRNTILDDFVISLRICKRGYRVEYEPDAFAIESSSSSIKEEKKRKIRISAGAFQSIVLLADLLNIFKYPRLSFQYISHRVLRWTLCPLFLPLILIANILLVVQGAGLFYTVFLVAQILFYLMALAGAIMSGTKKKIALFYISYYFLFINYSVYLGFFRFLKGKQSVLWEKAARGEFAEQKLP
jgi:poly-beta-1,6-N-acetyl-D-glucosamine synthase